LLLFKHRRNADGFRVFQKISPSIIDRFAWLRISADAWETKVNDYAIANMDRGIEDAFP